MLFNSIDLKSQAILAPMAGVTDSPFRRLVRKEGGGIVYSELASAEGLIRNSQKTKKLLNFHPSERPIGIQLFCGKPDSLAEAVGIVSELQPDFIDLNFGCPVKKVVKNNAGSAILRNLDLMKQLVAAAVKSTVIPVTAKIRIGWDQNSIVAVEAAKIIEGEGGQAVAVHGRTRAMGYSGQADWNEIHKVKKSVSILVFGNGDIHTPEDAFGMFAETGCDGVMVGRAAMGRPWLFHQIREFLNHGILIEEPSYHQRIETCIDHLQTMIDYYGYPRGLFNMRKHIGWYIKGMPNSSLVRQKIFLQDNIEVVINMLREYVNQLEAGDFIVT